MNELSSSPNEQALVERKKVLIDWKKPPAEPDSVWGGPLPRPVGVSGEKWGREWREERNH